MAYSHYERLSALDMSFLAMEDGKAHMHIGSVAVFDAEPLRGEAGGLDFPRILGFVESQLHKVPRFRQVLAWVPGFGHPVWVDDVRFNLLYHVRHTALPEPGDERQLKRMAGRILSQEFDRGKPLWENWFVDGLAGNRFAIISKMHHCMADGISGLDLGTVLMGRSPDYQAQPARAWLPRPAPKGSRLFLGELSHRARAPLALLRGLRGASEGGTRDSRDSVWTGDALRGLVESVKSNLASPSETPLNVPIGPHRRFDWTRLPLREVREIGVRAGGKVNDVVLAVATGALRGFLRRRGVRVEGLDFRAFVPVSVRRAAEQHKLGNRVSGMVARLPVDEEDPWRRLTRVVELTRELKSSNQSRGGDLLNHLVDLLPTPLLEQLWRRVGQSSAANLVITNVPGPQFPVYMLGARMLASYPLVPLLSNHALGIALFSYDGGLFWGFNSDWDALPDLHDVVEDVSEGLEALRVSPKPDPKPDPKPEEGDRGGRCPRRPGPLTGSKPRPALRAKSRLLPGTKPRPVPAAKPRPLPAAQPRILPAAQPRILPAAQPRLRGSRAFGPPRPDRSPRSG